jgi:hypothetical protein
MTRIQEESLKASLTKVIEAWLDTNDPTALDALPYMGRETAAHMASAAINVLAAVDDIHTSLDRDGMLKDESDG